MIDIRSALDYPEDFLWVFHPDESSGYRTVIERKRLIELQDGAPPEDEAERMVAADPKWLNIYLRHVIGEWPITITPGTPLPEWEPCWLLSVE